MGECVSGFELKEQYKFYYYCQTEIGERVNGFECERTIHTIIVER